MQSNFEINELQFTLHFSIPALQYSHSHFMQVRGSGGEYNCEVGCSQAFKLEVAPEEDGKGLRARVECFHLGAGSGFIYFCVGRVGSQPGGRVSK